MFVGLSKYFDVRIAKNQSEINVAIQEIKATNPTAVVGFIPTMGALHLGHISLVEHAKKEVDIVICSVFVNPTQFNNPADLKTYPRTIEEDIKLLEKHDCDILFMPSVDVVYPNGPQSYHIDLEGLDQGMEGTFRPGHFEGVCMVVERLFELVNPDKGFFGNKDFQQLAVITKMTAIRKLPITIVGVPIKRAENGLALSSRNALLSEAERLEATLIYRALKEGLNFSKTNTNSEAIKAKIHSFFEGSKMEVEYIAIITNDNLKPVDFVDANSTVCIVVFHGKVRLLDNMQFSDVLIAH